MGIRRKWLMTSVGLGILLNPLNSSMIAVAMSRLQHVYHLNYREVSWIIFAFYLASAVAQPVMGKAGDLFGRRGIFLSGLVVVSATSLLAPLSPTFGWLIVFRVVQSIGTSMIGSVGLALIRIHITEKQANALAVLSIFLSGAAAVGPSIGGFLIHWWDWPAIFLVNIPLIITSFLIARRSIPKDEPASPAAAHRSLRQLWTYMDGAGILLFIVGLVSLLVGFLSIQSLPYEILGLIGLLTLGIFVWHELKSSAPFIPLRTFAQHPAMTEVNLQFMLVNILFYSLFFGLPAYLQSERHLSELSTGVLMLSLGLCSLAASPLAGRWIDKSGPRPALLTSGTLMTAGSVWIVMLHADSPLLSIGLVLAAFGISSGLNQVGMQAALFRSTPKEIIGVASGLFLTSRYLGTILSSVLLDSVFGNALTPEGFRLLGAILAVLALTLVFLIWRRREPGSAAEQQQKPPMVIAGGNTSSKSE